MEGKNERVFHFIPEQKLSIRASIARTIRISREWVKWKEHAFHTTVVWVMGLLFNLIIIIAATGKASISTLVALGVAFFLTIMAFGLNLFGIPFHPEKERVRCFYFCLTEMLIIWGLGISQGYVLVGLMPLATFLTVWLYNGWRLAKRVGGPR